MNLEASFPLHLPQHHSPDIERTSSGRDLADALDSWLMEDFTHEDWLHVHSWSDIEEELS